MKSSRIAIRMNEELRQKVQKRADEFNVDMSTYVRMILAQHFMEDAKKEAAEKKASERKGRRAHAV